MQAVELATISLSFARHPISLVTKMPRKKAKLPYVVHSSGIHGNGVFAKKLIRKGTRIIEYRGVRSMIDLEREKPVNDPRNPHHTFLFELSDGSTIEAGVVGAFFGNDFCEPIG